MQTDPGTGPDKAQYVNAMFSRIARRYDLMNTLMTFGMHHGWRRAAARQTIVSPPGPALDLATGTGDLALELARVHPHRVIVGADFALGMLAVAQRKVEEANAPVLLTAADALSLPFANRTFACVTSAFLLRNLADLEQGLREMKRVTRPGGRIVALEITQSHRRGFSPMFRFYFHRVVPRVGQLVSGDREAYTYLPRSVDRFLTPAELTQLMERIGLRGVTYRPLAMGTVTLHTGIA